MSCLTWSETKKKKERKNVKVSPAVVVTSLKTMDYSDLPDGRAEYIWGLMGLCLRRIMKKKGSRKMSVRQK